MKTAQKSKSIIRGKSGDGIITIGKKPSIDILHRIHSSTDRYSFRTKYSNLKTNKKNKDLKRMSYAFL